MTVPSPMPGRACFLLFWALSAAWGRSAAPAHRLPPVDFPAQAQAGWSVRDAATGKTLEDKGAGQGLVPASIQKLFTTWIALEVLGPGKTFPTELYYQGALEKDGLRGDLIIKGYGDPGFAGDQLGPEHTAAAIFAQWNEAVKRLGIRRLDGCVRGDGSFLELEGPHPAALWEDVGNYYAGTAAGLCFNDNVYSLGFLPAPVPGRPLRLQGRWPVHLGIDTFYNLAMAGPAGGKDSAYIFGAFPSPVRVVKGTYPAKRKPFFIKGSLPNPPWTCARELQSYLAAHGMAGLDSARACGDPRSLDPAPATPAPPGILIARHLSPPLRELVRVTNQKSDNNYSAQWLALLGKEAGKPANSRGGLAAVYDYLGRHGFELREIHLKDGNGLSRSNWISPGQIAKLLCHASGHKAFPDFQASLIGASGTGGKLERYGAGWENRLWIKTGTLEGVASLAGYLRARSGRLLAFSVTLNNFDNSAGDAQRLFAPMLQGWAEKY